MPVITTNTTSKIYKVTPKRLDFTLYRGDTFDVKLDVKDRAGAAVNLSTFTASTSIKDAGGAVVKTPTLTLNDGGVIGRIHIAQDTTTLADATYTYTLRLVDSNGKARTILVGDIVITETVDA